MILNFDFVGIKFMTDSHAVNFHHKSKVAPWPNFRVKANEQVICSMLQSVVPLSTLTVNQCQGGSHCFSHR